MAKSLNEYANRVAQIIGQPDNHSMKERIKDMIKDYFAKYIIQSIDRNGITSYYKISLLVNMTAVDETKIINPLHDVENDPLRYIYIDYISATSIPKPMNIKNDAPFTKVSIPLTAKLFSYTSTVSYRIASTLIPTRACRLYTYNDNKIQVKRTIPYNNLVSNETITKIEIEGLWENPEEVIGFYGYTDNQDLELPFPNEMMSFIINELLKIEFGIVPKDTDITKE